VSPISAERVRGIRIVESLAARESRMARPIRQSHTPIHGAAGRRDYQGLATIPFLELLLVIEAEIEHLGEDPEESLFSFVGWYVDQDAFLGVVVADVHLEALSTAVGNADRVVDHIVIYQLGLASSCEAEARLSSRSEMAPVGFVGARNSHAR
jgi:hypothetical protein